MKELFRAMESLKLDGSREALPRMEEWRLPGAPSPVKQTTGDSDF